MIRATFQHELCPTAKAKKQEKGKKIQAARKKKDKEETRPFNEVPTFGTYPFRIDDKCAACTGSEPGDTSWIVKIKQTQLGTFQERKENNASMPPQTHPTITDSSNPQRN